MDKLIKKEVIKLYISQSLFLLISIFCACVPLFSDSVSLTGYKALAGLFIFAAIIIFEIIFLTTWFYGLNANLPAKFCLEAMPETLYEIDDNLNNGLFTEEETKKCKERFMNTMDWLNKMILFSKPFLIFDISSMLVIVFAIVLKQIAAKQLYFSNMYGISAFFIILQISSLYITCKFLFKSVRSWIERLHSIHETKGKKYENI